MTPVAIEELRPFLQGFDFPGLFVEGLGWNYHRGEPLTVQVNGQDHTLTPVAEKAGFQVFSCSPGQDSAIPEYPIRRRIESQVAKSAFEHLIIFVDANQENQVWQWVKREVGKPAACREYAYASSSSGVALLQRLQPLFVALEEEASLNITLVTSRVRAALDVERVTRRFYDRFRAELTAFGNFVEGISEQGDRDWYASLMLNRMMFVYFVQKQGFLDGDIDYLRNRLKMVQQRNGDGRFQQFYRIFLLRLFHEGLGQPEGQRAPELAALLGRVPFLNGGLFDVHDLERDYPDIAIPDEAFERVFDFFDGYRWHLDERPYREDNEINPDVLGYIFEKYVNQKQMGAYYTKEDITGYISRNTVIPFLFDAAKRECPVAFGPDGGVWRLLQDNPDRYIYPAVGHGIAWNARQPEDPKPLDAPHELPVEIGAGVDDVSKRGGWNRPAPDDYALPTETWREVVARRTRYHEVRDKLAVGKVTEINDLITLNLDVERFARDVIAQSEGPELLRAFWYAMRDVSVLDPTCGSGAFLFAALNILEPLYTACLEGMGGFLDDLQRSERPHSPNALSDFRDVLAQVERHPSERYFILKSIVLNNLYGVDIMEEAVEICKLRLFLKLVAQLESYDQIEPLPDIDFNVKAGNTLVGFTSLDAVRQAMTITPDGQLRALDAEQQQVLDQIEADAGAASEIYDHFRRYQITPDSDLDSIPKQQIKDGLDSLRTRLDRYQASQYGIYRDDGTAYANWRASHQPFHWFVEFYGIMSKGGFDVVIGNPPYVEYSKVKKEYTIRGYRTESCGNLYAFVMERCKQISSDHSTSSMIVPLSGNSTKRMVPLMRNFYDTYESVHLQTIGSDSHPSRLFDGVKFRLAIFVVSNLGCGTYTSRYMRWYADERTWLFDRVEYASIGEFRYETAIPKVSCPLHLSILGKLAALGGKWNESTSRDNRVLYHSAPVNWIRAHTLVPYSHSERDGQKASVELRSLFFPKRSLGSIQSILCSTTFFLWWLFNSDCYHLNRPEIDAFPLCAFDELEDLSIRLEEDMRSKTRRRVYHYKATGRVEYDEFYLKLSKPIIDEVDQVLAKHYGFTQEELDFIINYDIKYRMGREG
ncbi:MAG: SAM-dependent methyltransferase [Chloroflexi bacterium]|nr:SAM-dependent methyltransferase [Chloroflexota bacterium]MYD47682.1 SAM-dependent methyltransferase [Chloroflexota bacterium]